jgi:hypothetical protein
MITGCATIILSQSRSEALCVSTQSAVYLYAPPVTVTSTWKQQVGGLLIRGTMTKEIQLSRGKVALVDDDDFEYLNQYYWNALNPVPGYYYAARTVRGGTILMHREILNAPKSVLVDHVDGNGLNNQKYNLRTADHTINALNRRKNSNNKSGHRNVCWILDAWRVQLAVNGKNHLFPEKFADVDKAGEFAKQMREKYYGKYAGNRS